MRLIFVVCLSLFPFLSSYAQSDSRASEFTQNIQALEQKYGGRLGVAILSEQGKTLLEYRGMERFAMCSTFKALLAAAILARVDAKLETMDRKISYQASDLLDYAPISKEHLASGHLSVAQLSEAIVRYSDNTAANLLLNSMGGPQAFTDYLRTIGDTTTRLDRNEPSLNANSKGDIRDTTTPIVMSQTLQKILVGDVLSPASKEKLKLWMFGNTTGDAKLRAGFDPFWMVGDKTGSGANGASNDVAIIYPRGLPPFIISVFYTDSTQSADEKNTVIAAVARISSTVLSSQLK